MAMRTRITDVSEYADRTWGGKDENCSDGFRCVYEEEKSIMRSSGVIERKESIECELVLTRCVGRCVDRGAQHIK